MAKKQNQRNHTHHFQNGQAGTNEKQLNNERPSNSLKDMLGADALAKLKQVEKEMKAEQERAAKETAERLRREQEEKERNKSFGELLDEYERKGGGKYS